MPKKFFYRIEHNVKRVGPYNTVLVDDYAENDEDEQERQHFSCLVKIHLGIDLCGDYHKTPHQDGLGEHLGFFSESRFGFASLAKLKAWFGENHKLYAFMELYNFSLYRYEVTERFDSNRQSVAYSYDMRNQKILDWEVLFEK